MLRKMIETPENPYHLSWDITSACDLHCSFCYNQKKENEEVSKNLIDLILNQIIELAPLHLGIGGGEPTKSKYLLYVLEFLFKSMGNKMPVITIDSMQLSKNPELLVTARRYNEALRDNKIGFYLSIHGIGERHDYIVGQKDHFTEQMCAIQFLKESGVPFAIGVVPTKSNIDELDRILELALGIGAGLLNISQFVEIGKGAGQRDLNLSVDQYCSLLEWIVKTNKRLGKRFVVTHEHWLAAYDVDLLNNDMFVGCSAGIYYIGIRSNGDIVPCQLNTHVLGNVKKTTVKEVWKNSPDLLRWRIRNIDDPCGTCALIEKCGGCRCNAVAAGRGFFGADPICPVTKKEGPVQYSDNNLEKDFYPFSYVQEKGEITTVQLKLFLSTNRGEAICLRSDERNAFIELTGCAKEIFSILYEKNNLSLLEIKETLSHTYDEREIIRELSQLEQMGIVTCERE